MGWHSFDSAAGSSSCPLPWSPNLSRRDQCPSAARAFPARLACGGTTVGSYGRIQLHACSDVRRSYRAGEPHVPSAAETKRRARSRLARSLHIHRQPARDCGDVVVGISQPGARLSLSGAEPGISGHDLGRAARPNDTGNAHLMGFPARVSGRRLWGQAIRGWRDGAVRSGRRPSSWHRHGVCYRLRLVVRDRHVLPVPGDGRHRHRFSSADALDSWSFLASSDRCLAGTQSRELAPDRSVGNARTDLGAGPGGVQFLLQGCFRPRYSACVAGYSFGGEIERPQGLRPGQSEHSPQNDRAPVPSIAFQPGIDRMKREKTKNPERRLKKNDGYAAHPLVREERADHERQGEGDSEYYGDATMTFFAQIEPRYRADPE